MAQRLDPNRDLFAQSGIERGDGFPPWMNDAERRVTLVDDLRLRRRQVTLNYPQGPYVRLNIAMQLFFASFQLQEL